MSFDPAKFYLGVNFGWLDDEYGHDLGGVYGKGTLSRLPADADFADIIDAYFHHLKTRNITVVRMWLFEGLDGLKGPPPYSTSNVFAYSNQSDFRDRVVKIMTSAHCHGLQVYWTLLDGAGLLPRNDPSATRAPLHKHLLMKVVDAFKCDVVGPFLDWILPNQADVFAIDIINEVDWLWWKPTRKEDFWKWLFARRLVGKASDLAPFVKKIYTFIKAKAPSLQVTVSFAKFSELEKQFGANSEYGFVDFFDYHLYLDPKQPASKDCGEPVGWDKSKVKGRGCIIGEVGHYYPGDKDPQNDACQAKSTWTVMDLALKRDYSGVLLWRYAPVGDHHRLLRLPQSAGASTSLLGALHAAFKTAASTTVPPGGQDPYAGYERDVWRKVAKLVIPPGKKP